MRERKTFKAPDADENERQWNSRVGLACMALRHSTIGHWCGYVAVPAGHALYGKTDSEVYDSVEIDVHGGLTYASDHSPRSKPDGFWWVGFDCAHAGDLAPALGNSFSGDVYRDIDFVVAECERLAAQLTAKIKDLPGAVDAVSTLYELGFNDDSGEAVFWKMRAVLEKYEYCVRASEREACAKIADSYRARAFAAQPMAQEAAVAAEHIAAAIREPLNAR